MRSTFSITSMPIYFRRCDEAMRHPRAETRRLVACGVTRQSNGNKIVVCASSVAQRACGIVCPYHFQYWLYTQPKDRERTISKLRIPKMTLASLTLTTTGSSIGNDLLFVAKILQSTGLARGAVNALHISTPTRMVDSSTPMPPSLHRHSPPPHYRHCC